MRVTPYPEWLERQDNGDQGEPAPWSIEPGHPTRGNAWTNIDGKRMRVPLGADETSRAVRAHEMVHAKVSPINGPVVPYHWACDGITEALAVACEEFRVNTIASDAGFDMSHLHDGSEKRAGEMMAASNSIEDIVYAITSMEGTGAIKGFMSGIRRAVKDGKADPRLLNHANGVRKILRRNRKHWLAPWATGLASTEPCDVQATPDESAIISIPMGYRDFTLGLAGQLANMLPPKSGTEVSEYLKEGDPDVPDSGGSNEFARLILDKLPLTERVAGRLGRRRIACNTGKDPRRISRMLTDPEKRVFDRRAKGIGGVVLIDQSGSMHLSDDDVWNIVKAAPGCVVIGYSHGDRRGEPNCWVLADRGKVVSHVRSGNGGNGVDGPALAYALSRRRNNEPVVWVCDGYVTSATDAYVDALADVCINMVRKHGVHMVNNVNEALEAFSKVARGERLGAKLTGPMLAQASRHGWCR
jgi:hypothetical protein